MRKASFKVPTLYMSKLRSRLLSNVSLLWPQDWHVTRERSLPPNILCTQVVSANLGSIFLVDEEVSTRMRMKRKVLTGVDRLNTIFVGRQWHSARIHENLLGDPAVDVWQ